MPRRAIRSFRSFWAGEGWLRHDDDGVEYLEGDKVMLVTKNELGGDGNDDADDR